MTIQEALAKHVEIMGDDVDPVLIINHNKSVVIAWISAPELRNLVVDIYTDYGIKRLREYMWLNPAMVDVLSAAATAVERSGIVL